MYCEYIFMYMNNHVHSAPQSENREERKKEESHATCIKQTKIHIYMHKISHSNVHNIDDIQTYQQVDWQTNR